MLEGCEQARLWYMYVMKFKIFCCCCITLSLQYFTLYFLHVPWYHLSFVNSFHVRKKSSTFNTKALLVHGSISLALGLCKHLVPFILFFFVDDDDLVFYCYLFFLFSFSSCSVWNITKRRTRRTTTAPAKSSKDTGRSNFL